MMSSNGHIGAQIRKLRERTQKTQTELAAAVGIDSTAISKIESGDRQLRATELGAIAKYLGVSQLAILEPDSLLARLPVAPRAPEATSSADVLRRMTHLADLDNVLRHSGKIARPNYDEFESVANQELPDIPRSAALARKVRERLGLVTDSEDPFVQLSNAIERELGIDVQVAPLGAKNAMGASITDPSFPVILVNADQLRTRALFTLAHELGHVLFNDGEVLQIDHDLGASNSAERRANAFAANLLAPEASIKEIMGDGKLTADKFARMILKFGVSLESLTFRLQNLAIINRSGRKAIQELGWTSLIHSLHEAETVRRLIVIRTARAESSPPAWLAARALAGFQDGNIGAAPLAGLLGMNVETVIERVPPLTSDPIQFDAYSSPQDLPSETEHSFDTTPV